MNEKEKVEETPDSHDLGKLTKWYEGLLSDTEDSFPVCALFLTSGRDRRAHNIFRIYRSAFEELEAGFHDLVIFGQHGTSSTCNALIPGLGLSSLEIPSLILICGGKELVLHTTNLPWGELARGRSEEDGDGVPWRQALKLIKESVVKGFGLELDEVKGLKRVDIPGGTLTDTVGAVKLLVEAA
ncbi:MAG: hypothetical protein VYC59_01870 [Chloroflexota bacterium]|nr:hypothetical protein [Chloroflexota bacterium]